MRILILILILLCFDCLSSADEVLSGNEAYHCEHICESTGLTLHRAKYNPFGRLESCVCGREAEGE